MKNMKNEAGATGQAVSLEYLGDVIGGSSYFGSCPDCGRQHTSTHDRVQVRGHQILCARCAK